MINVSIFDKELFRSYLAVLSVISLLASFGLIVFQLPDDVTIRVVSGIVILVLLVVIFFAMWIHANLKKVTFLNFNNSVIEVKIGDIFSEPDLKVISFNEFFDTQVDERIIASRSLNGIFINQRQDKIDEINRTIENDERVTRKAIGRDDSRLAGKNKRYELGTVCQFEDYLLVAFSKFDSDNRANLRMRDYIGCLINFWNEVDIIYAGRSISIPLLGAGITRFDDYSSISEQELLELIIWSFKISRVRFTYPSKVSIVIHESIIDKINFYKLKEF